MKGIQIGKKRVAKLFPFTDDITLYRENLRTSLKELISLINELRQVA